jgi:hypothetical protein
MFKKNTSEVQSVDERIKVLESELSGLEKERVDIESAALSSIKKLQMESEIQDIIDQIGQKRKEIKNLRLDDMKAVRDEVAQKAQALADEKRSLLKRIKKIDAEGLRLKEIFEKNIPYRRLQVSSSQFVKMEKETFDTVRNMNVTDEGGQATYEKIPRKVEEFVDAIPDKIKRFQAEGWELCPGEKFEPELLDRDNSIDVLVVSIPDVFLEFFNPIGPMG